ncbi:HAD-like domain-containing protein [Pyronema omphalodes]|nr:HAD-like domain-containing protein [Pyronema omphalodes]
MIVSDVDGTLLDSHHLLPTTNPTHKVIRKIREVYPDLPIIISTGKQHRSTAELREQLDLHKFPCCHLNGNVIYNSKGEVVSESGLDKSIVRRVYDEMKAIGTSVFVYDYTTVYQLYHGEGDSGQWAQILRGYGELVIEGAEGIMEKIEAGELNPIKMAICQDAVTIASPKTILETKFAKQDFALTQALPFCVELIPSAHNKGTALIRLLKYWNETAAEPISPENVITFGDGENDVSMFRVSGMSVAMGNAMETARSEAIFSTDSNDEGGVGTFLEKVFWPTMN